MKSDKLYTNVIHCSKEDKELLMNQCVELFLKENPSMRGVTITEGFMFRRVLRFYLGWND